MLTLMTPSGPRPIAAMLFDMDGTMADSRPFHLEAWAEMAGRLAPDCDTAEVLNRTFGLSNRQIIPQLVDREMSVKEIDALSEQKEALYRRMAGGRVRPVDGLHDLVKRAASSAVGLAVASSALEANVRFVLEDFELERYFASVVHTGRVRYGKPDPETFLTAARDLGVSPSLCVVFEDARAGLEGARRAGMTAVAVDIDGGRDFSPWADLVVRDFVEVLPLLRG